MITKTPDTRKQAHIEDLSLARQAAAGNDDAFSVIVDRYSRLVYNVALRSTSSPEDAADISQETFLKAWYLMLLTVAGIVISLRDVHPLKAWL